MRSPTHYTPSDVTLSFCGGAMGTKAGTAALARLRPLPGEPPLLVAATGPHAGEWFDCPRSTPL